MNKGLVLVVISSLLVFSLGSVSSIQGTVNLKKNNYAEVSNSDGYISVPFHYQNNNYYCGPATLEMVFDYYGAEIPQAEIADAARTYPYVTYTDELLRSAHFSNLSTSQGDEILGSDITGYSARKLGYAAFENWGLTIDDLKTLIARAEPIIVLMWFTSSKVYGHYRVIIGYNTTHIITHDPWNKDWGGVYGGANTSITYETFLDLWEYSGYWGLLVYPWIIELESPIEVDKGDHFEVVANITYPCSQPFNAADYPASSCNATIHVQEGLELASGEIFTHSLGDIFAKDAVQTSWSVHANETGSHNILITALGIIEGTVFQHNTYPSYDYEDTIGGLATHSMFVVNQTCRVHNLDTSLDYTSIQDAIDANETLNGHTISVDEGIFYENVVLSKTLKLIGADEESTIIDGNRSGTVVDIVVDEVTISNFTFRNSGTYPYSPPDTGLRLINASNCVLVNNTIKECFHAILIFNSSMITLKNNHMLNNSYSLFVVGPKLCNYVNDIDITNTIDGKLVYYLVNQTNLIINPSTFQNAGYLALVNSTKITIENLAFSETGQAILFSHTANSTIKAVQIQDTYSGIFLYASHNNSILRNTLTHSWEGGIFLILSEDNTVSNNAILYGDQYGILLANSSNNIIANNEISHIEHDGLWISGSSHNIVVNNTLIDNHYSAIELYYSANYNTLVSNNIMYNFIAIKIEKSGFNSIFHNNFIRNEYGASSTSLNFWDNGYPSGGNYWDEYEGDDLYSGSHQDETGSDGIGDTSHFINFGYKDNYPLMGMFSDFDTTSEYHVQTICNSTIPDLKFNGTAISFNAAGEDDTAGFCRICIPAALMNDTFRVFVNGTEILPSPEPLSFSNSTHSYLYFSYSHSTQEIIIVPELPSLAILPLFMIITLLAAIVYRKRKLTIQLE